MGVCQEWSGEILPLLPDLRKIVFGCLQKHLADENRLKRDESDSLLTLDHALNGRLTRFGLLCVGSSGFSTGWVGIQSPLEEDEGKHFLSAIYGVPTLLLDVVLNPFLPHFAYTSRLLLC